MQLLARAYGYGQSWERTEGKLAIGSTPWEPTDARTGEGDENNPAASPGLSIARQSETLQLAGKAINAKDSQQSRLMRRATPEQRTKAGVWSSANDLRSRGRGKKYRTAEFEHWKQSAGAMLVPINSGAGRTVRALSRAQLAGPLPHVLLFAATLDLKHWERVLPYMVACGHPAWACEEVAREFYGMGRTMQAGSKEASVRIKVWADEIRKARHRVDDWLERAGPRVAENLAERGALIGGSVYLVTGDVSVSDGGESPRDARDPTTYNCGDLSGITSERWWRPERLGLDRHGRGDEVREWTGECAQNRCLEAPSQPRIGGTDVQRESCRAKRQLQRVDRLVAEDDGYAEPLGTPELRF